MHGIPSEERKHLPERLTPSEDRTSITYKFTVPRPHKRGGPSAQAADVCTVLVDGRILLDDGVLLTLDEEALLARAAQQTHTLLGRAAQR